MIGILLGLLATVFFCHNLCVAFELVVAIGQQQEITITSALMFIPTFLKGPDQSGGLFFAAGAFRIGSGTGSSTYAVVCPLFLAP